MAIAASMSAHVDDAEPADDLLGLVERSVDDDGAVDAVLDRGRGLDTECSSAPESAITPAFSPNHS